MDKELIESKAILGKAQEGYLDGSYNSETAANPWKVKPSVKKVFENILPIIEQFKRHVDLLSSPTHFDPEINQLQKGLARELFERKLDKPLSKMKTPTIYDLVGEHQRKCDIKYWTYIKRKLSMKRYRNGASLLKRAYLVRQQRLDQQYLKRQRDQSYKIDYEWVDDIPIYRSGKDEKEKTSDMRKESGGKEIGIILSKSDFAQISNLKQLGIFHLDEARGHLHWGENGRQVAQLLGMKEWDR